MTPEEQAALAIRELRERSFTPRGDLENPFGVAAGDGYWTANRVHTSRCFEWERGPDGAYRRIHQPADTTCE